MEIAKLFRFSLGSMGSIFLAWSFGKHKLGICQGNGLNLTND
jgi:hypothetical protein